jgi:hypothetical protein
MRFLPCPETKSLYTRLYISIFPQKGKSFVVVGRSLSELPTDGYPRLALNAFSQKKLQLRERICLLKQDAEAMPQCSETEGKTQNAGVVELTSKLITKFKFQVVHAMCLVLDPSIQHSAIP